MAFHVPKAPGMAQMLKEGARVSINVICQMKYDTKFNIKHYLL